MDKLNEGSQTQEKVESDGEVQRTALNKRLTKFVLNPREFGHPRDTYRTADKYALMLGYETTTQFLSFIRGKRVLDAGSGGGGLFKSLRKSDFAKQGPFDVINLNPKMVDPSFRRHAHEVAFSVYGLTTGNHDQRLIPALAQFLPFVDESFDAILDLMGPLVYADKDKDAFMAGLREYLRVLKRGGVVRFGSYGVNDKAIERVYAMVEPLSVDIQKLPARHETRSGVLGPGYVFQVTK